VLEFKIYTSVKDIPESWNSIVDNDLMLTTPYLKALEQASPSNIKIFYVAFFQEEKLVGITIIERVQLYLKDMFRKSSSSAIKTFFRNAISMVLKGNILVVGNLTHTGQHGISFLNEEVSRGDFVNAMLNATYALKDKIKNETSKNIWVILLKDYFKNDEIHQASDIFNTAKFSEVIVQPNMIMEVDPKWKSIEDYVKSLNKKYRTRYNRARKKFNSIERRELNIEIIKRDSEVLHGLYMNVSNNAKFNTFILPEHHFFSLKQELQDNFRVFGYYLENKLIGFYTLILNHDVLETYFLGYDSEHQYENQLYLNMLYDMLGFAIEHKFGSVVYARTAMEIKSSVGAKPVPMTMYMRHTNEIANLILKGIFNFMKPNQKWEERHPFD